MQDIAAFWSSKLSTVRRNYIILVCKVRCPLCWKLNIPPCLFSLNTFSCRHSCVALVVVVFLIVVVVFIFIYIWPFSIFQVSNTPHTYTHRISLHKQGNIYIVKHIKHQKCISTLHLEGK